MPRLFLFTTGISLFDEDKSIHDVSVFNRFSYNDRTPAITVFSNLRNQRRKLASFGKQIVDLNLDLDNDSERKQTTAEIASFYLLAQPPERKENKTPRPRIQPNDKVIFLCSDTAKGAWSALVNAMLLAQHVTYYIPNDNKEDKGEIEGFSQEKDGVIFNESLSKIRIKEIEIHVIEGLDPVNPTTLEDQAIPNMVEAIADYHYGRSDSMGKTILNYTGGPKAMIPILAQVCCVIQDIEMHCLFEDSSDLVEHPLMPINLPENIYLHQDAPYFDALRADETMFYEDVLSGRTELNILGKAVKVLLEKRKGRMKK